MTRRPDPFCLVGGLVVLALAGLLAADAQGGLGAWTPWLGIGALAVVGALLVGLGLSRGERERR